MPHAGAALWIMIEQYRVDFLMLFVLLFCMIHRCIGLSIVSLGLFLMIKDVCYIRQRYWPSRKLKESPPNKCGAGKQPEILVDLAVIDNQGSPMEFQQHLSHTYRDIRTSGLDGHIYISVVGRRWNPRLWVWPHHGRFFLQVWSWKTIQVYVYYFCTYRSNVWVYLLTL